MKNNLCPAWELIIVNNASTDNTSEVASQLCVELVIENWKIVEESTPGQMSARKRGVKEATFDIVIFCDDDNWLDENYLDVAFEFLRNHPKAGIIGGYNKPVFEIEPPDYFTNYYGYLAVAVNAPMHTTVTKFICGAGMTIRKDLIEFIFSLHSIITGRTKNALMAGDDTEICLYAQTLGYDLYFNPKLKLQHFIEKKRITDRYISKLHFGIGSSNFYLDLLIKNLSVNENKTYFLGKAIRLILSRFIVFAKIRLAFFYSNNARKLNLYNKYSYQSGYLKELFKNVNQINNINTSVNLNKIRINEFTAKSKIYVNIQLV